MISVAVLLTLVNYAQDKMLLAGAAVAASQPRRLFNKRLKIMMTPAILEATVVAAVEAKEAEGGYSRSSLL